jgi:diaminopropionate ammonia-lyase
MIKEIPEYCFKYLIQTPKAGSVVENFTEKEAGMVINFHRQLPGYQPTQLARLHQLAQAWGIGEILVKDESTRFNLKAFKVLGGSYAIARLLCQKLGVDLEKTDYAYLVSDEVRQRIGQMTLTTATDGNHGRGVAWTAEQFRQHEVVYMPKG